MTDAARNKKNLDFCRVLYALYAASLLSFATDTTVSLLGLAAGIAGICMAYARRSGLRHTPCESHITYLIRTFWIGSGVWLPIATVIAAYVIWTYSDTGALDAVLSGQAVDVLSLTALTEQYLAANRALLTTTLLSTFGPVAAWWLWRCFKGYRLLAAGKPVTSPQGWF